MKIKKNKKKEKSKGHCDRFYFKRCGDVFSKT